MALGRSNLTASRSSPIHDLPDDILILIFLLDVMEHPSRSPFPAASQVCRRWRAVAINTGNLWPRISVTDRKSVDAARTLLKRSKECPLEIILHPTFKIYNNRDKALAVQTLKEILSMLVPLVRRIKHITLEWAPSLPLLHRFFLALAASPHSNGLRGIKMTTPGLTLELDIANKHPTTPDGLDCPSTLNLAQRTLTDAPSRSKKGKARYHFLWHKMSNLRRLVVHDEGFFPASIEYSQLYEILETSPGLEELSLRGMRAVTTSDQDDVAYPVQTMRSLQMLNMASLDVTIVTRLLGVIRAPNLQTLVLRRSQWPSEGIIPPLTLGQRIQAGLASVLESTSIEGRPGLSISVDGPYLLGTPSLGTYSPSVSTLMSLKSLQLYFAHDSTSSPVYSRVFTPLIEGGIHLLRLHLKCCRFLLNGLGAFVMRRAESGKPLESLMVENCVIAHSFNERSWMALLEVWLKERVKHVELRGCVFDLPPTSEGVQGLSEVLRFVG